MESVGYNIDRKNILPDSPGVYKFFDTDKTLVYVGKAKNLKKRVYSYFNKNGSHNRKTRKLVKEITHFNFVVVESETDALLLENNLIKTHQPKYNILLKDDKTFPYLCIVNEPFPRVISTRKLVKSKGEYFGPYSSVVAMNSVLDLIRKLHSIRTCSLNLSEKSIKKGKYKVCLEYHIGNCKGPCEQLQDECDYLDDIANVRNILKGRMTEVSTFFKNKMSEASQNLQFEEAQRYKERVNLLEKFQSKSTVVNPKLSDINIFTYVEDDKWAFVNYMFVENGSIVKTQTIELKKALDETPDIILQTVSFDILKDTPQLSQDILSNYAFSIGEIGSQIPKIGDKYKLIQLSIRNAFELKKNKILNKPLHDKSILIIDQLKKDLGLKTLPKHIECFDNSNIQGTNPVASMVCFKDGKPSKKNYRHYNIKTVIGADDFASMYEVVKRRYKRLIEENQSLPDLVVIDGGKGQLSSASKALKELDVYGKIPIIGIAKKLEEIYYPEDKYPLHISKKSVSLRLLQHLRDEAHRFAITFHRNKRSKSSLVSELTDIKGIGAKTYNELIKVFKSTSKLKQAKLDEIVSVVGNKKALTIYDYFKNKKEE